MSNNQPIDNIITRRELGDCFYIHIPLCQDEASINEQIQQAMRIEKAVDMMLDGSASIWDMFELIEDAVPNMDQYTDEVGQNLYYHLLSCPQLRTV